MAGPVDIALVSLGTTMGWRQADASLAAQLEAVGASCAVETMRLGAAAQLRRSMLLTDVVEALGARRAASGAAARATVYCSFTAALAQPSRHPHAIRFDSIPSLNRPGAGGAWQRRREAAILRRADLLLPMSEAASAAAARAVGGGGPRRVVLPASVSFDAAPAPDAPASIAYAANPVKRGLDILCAAWAAARADSRLAIGGIDEGEARAWLRRQGVAVPAGVEFLGPLPRERWTALVAGAGVYVSAARYEDWGLAQMEALAAGVPLVTVPTAGANVALPLARELAPALVAADDSPAALAAALRAGLALDPAARAAYAERAAALMEPYSDAAQRRLVAEEILPALLGERP